MGRVLVGRADKCTAIPLQLISTHAGATADLDLVAGDLPVPRRRWPPTLGIDHRATARSHQARVAAGDAYDFVANYRQLRTGM